MQTDKISSNYKNNVSLNFLKIFFLAGFFALQNIRVWWYCFFGAESYEPERTIKLKKACCFYGNSMYFTWRNRLEPLLRATESGCRDLVCHKRLIILANSCSAEFQEVASILVLSVSCVLFCQNYAARLHFGVTKNLRPHLVDC